MTGFVPLPEWPAALPEHFSYSSLSMFERCPEQFRRRYLLGEKTPPSGSLIWGTADGYAHGYNFNQKIDSHIDVPVNVVQDAFRTSFDYEIENADDEIEWNGDKPGDLVDRGVALVTAYHGQVSPRVQPVGVEEKFSLDVPGVPVPFIGYIDVSEEAQSIERKTAGAKASSVPPWYRLQTLTYAAARKLPVEMHISTKTKVPAVYTALEEPGLFTEFTDGVSVRAQRIIQTRVWSILAVFNEFGAERPWPDAIGSQAWHTAVCDMCGFRPTCSWWA